jgi:hypothetical protein
MQEKQPSNIAKLGLAALVSALSHTALATDSVHPKRGQISLELNSYAAKTSDLVQKLRIHHGISIPTQEGALIVQAYRLEDGSFGFKLVQGSDSYRQSAYLHKGESYLSTSQLSNIIAEKGNARVYTGAVLAGTVSIADVRRIAREYSPADQILAFRFPAEQKAAQLSAPMIYAKADYTVGSKVK